MPESQDVLTRLLGEEPTATEDLGGSARSRVLRVTLADGSTVVAKQFTGDDAATSFLRETVGLRHLPRTPTMLASDPETHLVLMSDVGQAPTLADHLLGEDGDAAWAAAIAWAGALGDVAGRSVDDLAAVRTELSGVQVYDPTPALRDGVARLAELAGVDPERAADDLDTMEALLETEGAEVAWPTDTCPDNALATGSGWVFLDLEGTDVSHAALVAAYPALPFATCWCAFDPPEGLTEQMLSAFTLALSGHAPHITDRDEWRGDVDVASAIWIVATTSWLLPRALEGDGPIGPDGVPSPTRRQLLRSRWSWLAMRLTVTTPVLAELGAAAVAWADREWGESAASVGPYPAFAEPPSDDEDPDSDDAEELSSGTLSEVSAAAGDGETTGSERPASERED
ncbi:hypothetical protein C8046_12670 [Serinibacter arcticus]|uniref:Aminoglycoside phosphotransferase domain-containing protein n=1 Tax=Serinibacter arcticus TaxID=1655435 RepID=A0A2U1ZWN2_9MICO|nr:hypothetical protein [Serinibacter arcticus]PWD51388.1 hypothetical protein C8046_12670 [Serinibacter arcticus]